MDDECKAMKAIAPVKQIGMTLPQLKGKYFYCKGTGKRMRDLAKEPMQNGSIIRICDDCASYEVIADERTTCLRQVLATRPHSTPTPSSWLP